MIKGPPKTQYPRSLENINSWDDFQVSILLLKYSREPNSLIWIEKDWDLNEADFYLEGPNILSFMHHKVDLS